MELKADRQGFLTGSPLGHAEADRMLAGIKGDTGRILALMRQSARPSSRAGAGAPVSPAPGRRAFSSPLAQVASPMGRAGSAAGRLRDAQGRFMAGPSPAASQADRRMAQTAEAAATVAREVAAQRRDAKADKASGQARGADGRFGAGSGRGGRGGEGGGFGPGGAAIAGGVGNALQGAEQIDPLLGAIGEVRGAYNAISGVVSPVGRAAAGIFGRGATANDEPVGWLRRMWRELRAGRKESERSGRELLRGVKGIKPGPGGDSGGFMSTLAGLVPALTGLIPGLGAITKALGSIGVGAGGIAAGAGAGLKGLIKRIPGVGALFEAVTGVIEDVRIQADDSLSDAEKRRQRSENAGGTIGGIGGALGGAGIGTAIMPGIGTAVGAVIGGLAGSKTGKELGGWISKFFESGKGGAGTISTGKGDLGGKSYGTHQLSSNMGTLQSFLASSGYGSQFAGLEPGSAAFDAKWKAIAASDPNFEAAQRGFIERTHVLPQMAKLKASGIDLSGRGQAVQEAIFSTATQFGPGSDLIGKALAGANVGALSDAQIVAAIQDYKIANNASLFRSSSAAVQAGTLNRAMQEKQALLGLARMPALAAAPMLSAPGAAPAVEMPAAARSISAASPAVIAPGGQAGQDVRDRTIAHIVTGGIGGASPHR